MVFIDLYITFYLTTTLIFLIFLLVVSCNWDAGIPISNHILYGLKLIISRLKLSLDFKLSLFTAS